MIALLSDQTGQLGYGDTDNRGDEPDEMGVNLMDVDLGDDFVVDTVSLGGYYSCALSTSHIVVCWGRGDYGRLGIGDTTGANWGDEPGEMGSNLQRLSFPSDFVPVQISAGGASTCVVSADGRCACFGYGGYGEMGQGNHADAYAPTLVDLGDAFVVESVRVGRLSACAVCFDSDMKVCVLKLVRRVVLDLTVYCRRVLLQCWGYNAYGQLGYAHTNAIGDNAGEMGDNLGIVNLGTAFVVKQVQSGWLHRCALSTDGQVKV